MLFLSKIGPKNENCQLKLKFGYYTNSNMQNSIMVFTFYVLEQKYSFWANLVQKNQNCKFRLKIGAYANSNMPNSMVLLTFSVFDRKHHFEANLFQKFKIVCLC